MKRQINAVESPEQKAHRETVEKIADNISRLADSIETLLNGPVKRKTILALLAWQSGQPQHIVDKVLTALTEMKGVWLNK